MERKSHPLSYLTGAGRLLYELIINNGKTLDRDDLIKKVWEDHGFSGSSVSLNVAISEIRKAFRTLGCDPLLIKTIRGKGFSLAAHIEHHTVRPPVVSTLSEQSASESFDTLAHKKDADPPKQLISLHRLFISLCTLLLITVIGTAVLLLHQRDSYAESLKDSDMHLLGKVDRCTVYLIDKNMYQPRQHYFNHVKRSSPVNISTVNIRLQMLTIPRFKKVADRKLFPAICYQQDSIDDYKNCISYRSLTGS